MGGDRSPEVIVAGALDACALGLGPITLVGDPDRIAATIKRRGDPHPDDLRIVESTEIIGMAEHPGRAARTKRHSSMHVGFDLVRKGEAQAFISAGNSGAMLAVGVLTLRRLERCDRPAIATSMPTLADPVVLLDLGANVECRASHLVQFALMGAAFAEAVHGIERPSVALLSNGTEPTKGTETLRDAHRLLTLTDLKYVGYVEGSDLPHGKADVVVADGFVGNVVLKLTESIASGLFKQIEEAIKSDWRGRLGGGLMRGVFKQLQARFDWRSVGAAPLLGLNGLAFVAHGASDAEAVVAAVRNARRYAQLDLIARIGRALEVEGAPSERTQTAELPITR
jgi:glycerol-3-phosphate acyltransferase PlsX